MGERANVDGRTSMGERRELGEVQSAPCADNSAAFAASKRQMKVSIKVGENAEGSAASKADLFRDSYALLTLVGSLIHIDHEYWGILLTKQHDKGLVPSRFTRYFTQELPSSHDHHMELSSQQLFRLGINVELLLLKRRQNIDARR